VRARLRTGDETLARLYYETLSEESARCLDVERSRRRAHVTIIAIFDSGPLSTEAGGVEFDRIREVVSMRLAELPRLRSKLRRVPMDGHPVWVDDPEFHLDYHLQQSSLPRPGNHEQLCRTAARIAATRLDRSRPLWDCWILEGLEGGRFALVLKMHRALANLEGADLLRAILSTSSDPVVGSRGRYSPRPAPSPVQLFTEEVVKGWSPSRRLLSRSIALLRQPAHAIREAQNQTKSMLHLLGYKLRPAGESPFDGVLGPHRSFAIQELDLAAVQEIRRSLGGSVHDGVLTVLCGALRRFMIGRHINPVSVDLRALTPILDKDERAAHCSVVELPIWEDRPAERHGLLRDQTRRIRIEEDVATGESISAGLEWNASRLLVIGARALKQIDTGHVAILQSPGPQEPLYLDGAELLECYGILPLRDSSGLGITVLSYAGKLFFAFNADSNLVPDVGRLQDALNAEVSDILAVVAEKGPALRAVGNDSN
jgi:diacylglycerol O-acyltransferase